MIDALQTLTLAVVAALVAYAVLVLRKELKKATSILLDVTRTQAQLHENVRRVWERIDALETRQGIRGDVDTFVRVKRFLDVLETGPSTPPPAPRRFQDKQS
jgi:hypothetical protein